MELYPGWSARDNYGYGSKKKKRKKDRSPADSGGINSLNCAFVFVFYLDFIFINLMMKDLKLLLVGGNFVISKFPSRRFRIYKIFKKKTILGEK